MVSGAIEERIRALDPWFHNIDLEGVQTARDHFLGDYPACKFAGFADVLPEDLEGRSVLDIGCNAGFYSLEMKRRGAGRVLAIDSDPRYLAQARLVFEVAGAEDIELREMSVYGVGQLGERFDLVIFMGVFYHLRHPMLALDLIHEHVAGDQLLFQSMQRGAPEDFDAALDYPFQEHEIFTRAEFPKLHFIEHGYAGDPTNWFVPNGAATAAMLRSAGFAIEIRPEPEVYLCRRTARPPHVDPPPMIAMM
ncbi:MAG: tRNA (mo5U34)-methyltransferase [Limimaricola cinnabarinus]